MMYKFSDTTLHLFVNIMWRCFISVWFHGSPVCDSRLPVGTFVYGGIVIHGSFILNQCHILCVHRSHHHLCHASHVMHLKSMNHHCYKHVFLVVCYNGFKTHAYYRVHNYVHNIMIFNAFLVLFHILLVSRVESCMQSCVVYCEWESCYCGGVCLMIASSWWCDVGSGPFRCVRWR